MPDSNRHPAAEVLESTISRVIELVRGETDLLAKGGPIDWQDFIDGKSRLLLELNRTQRSFTCEPNPHLIELASEMQEVLLENSKSVGLQLRASKQIIDMLASIANEFDSDGTYSITRRYR